LPQSFGWWDSGWGILTFDALRWASFLCFPEELGIELEIDNNSFDLDKDDTYKEYKIYNSEFFYNTVIYESAMDEKKSKYCSCHSRTDECE